MAAAGMPGGGGLTLAKSSRRAHAFTRSTALHADAPLFIECASEASVAVSAACPCAARRHRSTAAAAPVQYPSSCRMTKL